MNQITRFPCTHVRLIVHVCIHVGRRFPKVERYGTTCTCAHVHVIVFYLHYSTLRCVAVCTCTYIHVEDVVRCTCTTVVVHSVNN